MSNGCACGAGARRAAFMLGAGTGEGLFDARLDVAFGLAADGCQFGDHKVACAFKHPLLTE